MNLSDESKKAFKNRGLREIHPDVESRKIYAANKLGACKLQDPVLVCIEPHPKTLLQHVFLNMVVERSVEAGQIAAHLHKNVLKLGPKSCVYLFTNKKYVILNSTIGSLAAKSQ